MNPTTPLLYTYRRCPYAMRARMALLVAGVGFDAQEIVLRDKPAALLRASPKGTVPMLVLPDDTVLEPLEARLAQAQFLGGQQPCATDIGVFPFVRQFAAAMYKLPSAPAQATFPPYTPSN